MGSICMSITGNSVYTDSNQSQNDGGEGVYLKAGDILPLNGKESSLEYIQSIPMRATWIPEKKTHNLESVSWIKLLKGAKGCIKAIPTKDEVLDVDGFFHNPCYTFNDFIWEFKTAKKWISGHLEWINPDKTKVYISQFYGKFITPNVVYTDKLKREQYERVEGKVKCLGTTYSHGLFCFIDKMTVRSFQFGFDGVDDIPDTSTSDRIFRKTQKTDVKDTVKYLEENKRYSKEIQDYVFPNLVLPKTLNAKEIDIIPPIGKTESEESEQLQSVLDGNRNKTKKTLNILRGFSGKTK